MAIRGLKHTRSGLFEVTLQPISVRSVAHRRRTKQSERRLVERVRGEFSEMPGFSPTLEQAARLFSLSTDDCHRVFGRLLTEGFLARSADGRYRLTLHR